MALVVACLDHVLPEHSNAADDAGAKALTLGLLHFPPLALAVWGLAQGGPVLNWAFYFAAAGLLLLDHPDYLRLGETAFPHSSAPSRFSRLYIRLRDLAGGRSSALRDAPGLDGRRLRAGRAATFVERAARVTNLLTLYAPRPSDHHAHPTRGFETLRIEDDAPRLPHSLPVMVTFALWPWWWCRRVMNPRVDARGQGDATMDSAAA